MLSPLSRVVRRVDPYPARHICRTCGLSFHSDAGARVHKEFNPTHDVISLDPLGDLIGAALANPRRVRPREGDWA